MDTFAVPCVVYVVVPPQGGTLNIELTWQDSAYLNIGYSASDVYKRCCQGPRITTRLAVSAGTRVVFGVLRISTANDHSLEGDTEYTVRASLTAQ